MRPQKAKFEDILAFAELALDDPEVLSILRRQTSEPTKLDEETEHSEMVLLSKADEYVKSRGLSWKLRSGYKDAFRILAAVVNGDIESVRDPQAKEIVKNSPFIDFGNP